VPRWSTDWWDALGPDIDAVLNLTPAPAHGEINLALASAGKHFYTEKPFAQDVAEGARIADAAGRSGSVIVAAPSILLFPQVRRAAELLASGTIGKIHAVRAHGAAAPPPWQGYLSDSAPYFSAAVGPLSDMGVYPLHAITGLVGNAVEVCAMTARTRDSFVVQEGPYRGNRVPVEADDNWQLLLTLSGGALASVTSSFCVHRFEGPELELAGERGTIAISLLDCSQPLRIFRPGGSWQNEAVSHARVSGPDHVLGVEHLLQCIRDATEPIPNIAHAMHVMAIRAAASESACSGRHITIRPREASTLQAPVPNGENGHD
jgi:predicted dehydrogenase